MENNKNTSFSSSDSLICKKIRQVLANCPTFQAINNRISLYHHQDSKTMAISSKSVSSSSSSPPAKTTATQNKPTRPQNVKVHSEEAEVIPIKFDYSTPISKPAASSHVRITDQQGKKDINYAVTEYLERVGGRIRAVSNVGGGRGQGQGEGPPDDEADNKKNKKKDNHRDYFSNFIHIARNKFRTTSTIRRD